MKTPAFLLRRVGGLLCLALVLPVFGQNSTPRTTPTIGYLYPAGGQRGKEVTISVGGEKLTGANTAYLSVPGAQLRVLGYDRPASQREIQDAREKLQQLQEKRAAVRAAEKQAKTAAGQAENAQPEAGPKKKGKADAEKPTWTAVDEKAMEDVRALLAKRPARLTNPAIAETVTLLITLPPDAKSGDHELRLQTPAGLSNPMVFQVSDLPESTDTVITGSVNPPTLPAAREASLQDPAKKSAREVKLPTIVNGQIMPGEVDRIRFSGTKGQKLTIAVSARALIPYLADAVPGWFQATLALFDPTGREVAYEDDYRFNPDPVVAYTIATDGPHTIEIKDSIYRGREDFVYRIALGELPFLSGIFPLGSAAQPQTTFDLLGWNLPSDKITIPAANRPSGTFLLAVRNQGQISNSVRFAIDGKPETMETARSNQTSAEAQPITLPSVVNGRVDAPGDHDFFVFEGQAGEEIVAEVLARRLGSPLDSVLELTDSAGQRVAFNDDFDDKASGLITHQADSRIVAKLPASGRYFLRLADTQHRGGADFAYRLRIGAPLPDFELRVVPSTINVKAGANVPVTVFALRRDGFDGEIILGLKDAPRGFFLSGARIPPGQEKVQLTLTAPPSPLDQPCELRFVGQGTIAGKLTQRSALPADDMMQAFLYRHLVTAKEMMVSVSGRGSPSRLMATAPLKLTPGGEARIQVASASARNVSNVKVELSDPPEGITVKRTRTTRDGFEVTFACDPAKVKAGLQGNLILNAFAERAPAKAGKQAQRSSIGIMPALPFEIVAAPPPKRST
jgi:hypothetical protein